VPARLHHAVLQSLDFHSKRVEHRQSHVDRLRNAVFEEGHRIERVRVILPKRELTWNLGSQFVFRESVWSGPAD